MVLCVRSQISANPDCLFFQYTPTLSNIKIRTQKKISIPFSLILSAALKYQYSPISVRKIETDHRLLSLYLVTGLYYLLGENIATKVLDSFKHLDSTTGQLFLQS